MVFLTSRQLAYQFQSLNHVQKARRACIGSNAPNGICRPETPYKAPRRGRLRQDQEWLTSTSAPPPNEVTILGCVANSAVCSSSTRSFWWRSFENLKGKDCDGRKCQTVMRALTTRVGFEVFEKFAPDCPHTHMLLRRPCIMHNGKRDSLASAGRTQSRNKWRNALEVVVVSNEVVQCPSD